MTTATPTIPASPRTSTSTASPISEPGGPSTTLTGFDDWSALRLNQVGSRRNFAGLSIGPLGSAAPQRRFEDSSPTGRKILADGSWLLADGSQILADGAVFLADGAELLADGSSCSRMDRRCSPTVRRILADGAELLADGAVLLSDGHVLLADGSVFLSDGAELLADGAVFLGDGVDAACGWRRVPQRRIAAARRRCHVLVGTGRQRAHAAVGGPDTEIRRGRIR